MIRLSRLGPPKAAAKQETCHSPATVQSDAEEGSGGPLPQQCHFRLLPGPRESRSDEGKLKAISTSAEERASLSVPKLVCAADDLVQMSDANLNENWSSTEQRPAPEAFCGCWPDPDRRRSSNRRFVEQRVAACLCGSCGGYGCATACQRMEFRPLKFA
jgi:hypothetical protein